MPTPSKHLAQRLILQTWLLALALAVSACGSIKTESRVSTSLQARQYNSVASTYMPSPASVNVAEMSDGARVLRVAMTLYNGQQSFLQFPAGSGGMAAAHIDKYLEWETLARSRGDALTKDIGRSPAWSSMGAGSGSQIKMSLHSGNAKTHLLVATYCAAGTCSERESLYFDRTDAIELRRLLLQLDAGALSSTDPSIYK